MKPYIIYAHNWENFLKRQKKLKYSYAPTFEHFPSLEEFRVFTGNKHYWEWMLTNSEGNLDVLNQACYWYKCDEEMFYIRVLMAHLLGKLEVLTGIPLDLWGDNVDDDEKNNVDLFPNFPAEKIDVSTENCKHVVNGRVPRLIYVHTNTGHVAAQFCLDCLNEQVAQHEQNMEPMV